MTMPFGTLHSCLAHATPLFRGEAGPNVGEGWPWRIFFNQNSKFAAQHGRSPFLKERNKALETSTLYIG